MTVRFILVMMFFLDHVQEIMRLYHAIIQKNEWQGAIPKKVVIEDNVWIGANVTFGKNTIIGSGSVVTKNIPENVIAVVNPWSVLREIAEEDKIISL